MFVVVILYASMAAPFKRLKELVLILSPMVGESQREVYLAAVSAARLAYQQRLRPLSPMLYCYPWMTPEEMARELQWERSDPREGTRPSVAQWCFQRAGRLWLVYPRRDSSELYGGISQDLDRFSFEALRMNQRGVDRRPVLLVSWERHEPQLVPLDRGDVESLIRANLAIGLGGALDAED